ncbi:MAG: oligosaccharide flippase family protein [Epulopiscium sp.]|nr:oligosaccharide flippase family protein [Candidatus Epulonipiscium sp.]
MNSLQLKKRGMAKDTLVFLIAKMLEGVLGILALSLYTRYFDPYDFGQYTLINTTVMTMEAFFLGWLMHSVFRYFDSSERNEQLPAFYSTSFFAWLFVNAFMLGGTGVFLKIMSNRIQPSLLRLSWLGFFVFVFFSGTQILLSLLAAQRRILFNGIIAVFSIGMKLLFITVIVFFFSSQIEYLLLVYAFVDLIVMVLISYRLKIFRYIRWKYCSKTMLQSFLHYGLPLLGVTFTMSVLNLSDRYMIQYFYNSSYVAIYYGNYSLVAAGFNLILTGVMRGVYPMILQTWNEGDVEYTKVLLSQAVRYYLILVIPAIIGISVLACPLATVFLDKAYVPGWPVMIWVAMGMGLLGLTEYNNKVWELTATTKMVFYYSLVSATINVLLNLWCIPRYGYQAAAMTTMIAYGVYFIMSYIGSRKKLKWHLPLKTFLRILGSGLFMGGILYFLKQRWSIRLVTLGLLVVLGIIIYFVCLYLTGEIKSECKIFLNRTNKKHGEGGK